MTTEQRRVLGVFRRADGMAAVLIVALAMGLATRAGGPRESSAAGFDGSPSPMAGSGRLLGELVGPDGSVQAHSAPGSPTYAVLDRSGRVLASGLRADEVYRSFPGLEIERMILEPRPSDGRMVPDLGALMMVETDG